MNTASVPISQLNKLPYLTSDDFLPVVDSGSMTTYRSTVQDIGDWMEVSGSASCATSASYATRSTYSDTSSYSYSSSFLIYPNTSTSSYAQNAKTAAFADQSTSSSFSQKSYVSDTASFFNVGVINFAESALSASWASKSLSSDSSSWATRSISASFADSISGLAAVPTASYLEPTVIHGNWTGKLQKFPFVSYTVMRPFGVTAWNGCLYVVQQSDVSAFYNVLKIDMVTNQVTVNQDIQRQANYTPSWAFKIPYCQGYVTKSNADNKYYWYLTAYLGRYRIPLESHDPVTAIVYSTTGVPQDPTGRWDDNYPMFLTTDMDFSTNINYPDLYDIQNSFYWDIQGPTTDMYSATSFIFMAKYVWKTTGPSPPAPYYSQSYLKRNTVNLSNIGNNAELKRFLHYAAGTSGPMFNYPLIHTQYNPIKKCYYLMEGGTGMMHIINHISGDIRTNFNSADLTYSRSIAIPAYPSTDAQRIPIVGADPITDVSFFLYPRYQVIYDLATGQEQGITFVNSGNDLPPMPPGTITPTTGYKLSKVGYMNWPETP